jgi:hypothetical protein
LFYLVTKNQGEFKIQGNINNLKKGFKVKITGHVQGIGANATMEGNTPQQLATDLESLFHEGEQPSKVSAMGCHSGAPLLAHFSLFPLLLLVLLLLLLIAPLFLVLPPLPLASFSCLQEPLHLEVLCRHR